MIVKQHNTTVSVSVSEKTKLERVHLPIELSRLLWASFRREDARLRWFKSSQEKIRREKGKLSRLELIA